MPQNGTAGMRCVCKTHDAVLMGLRGRRRVDANMHLGNPSRVVPEVCCASLIPPRLLLSGGRPYTSVMRVALRPLAPVYARPLAAQNVVRSAYSRHRSTTTEPATEKLSPRWLADVKQRLGKCMTFGMQAEQVARAGAVLETVAKDWRELVAGSEGFLTSEDRRGFYRHAVVWGEMDSMVSLPCYTQLVRHRADRSRGE
jgi:hypothetical protein